MNLYIEQFKNQLTEYEAKCGMEDSVSILELLWYLYSASNPLDDGRIEASERALAPVFQELSWKNSDILFDLISDLCAAYQRAAFLEGIQIGYHLVSELGCEQ